ncbi:MAG TPA: ATP/GTP-binding protein [Streptosporangiaceae bacterium]
MSPRKNRRSPDPPAAGSAGGVERVESGPDGDWQVRRITGAAATKTYRCPGCDHEIPPGVAHVVAWQSDADDRRHWHTPCWTKRLDRAPRTRRPGPRWR